MDAVFFRMAVKPFNTLLFPVHVKNVPFKFIETKTISKKVITASVYLNNGNHVSNPFSSFRLFRSMIIEIRIVNNKCEQNIYLQRA